MPHKPSQDLLRHMLELGREQGLRPKLSLWVADQKPTNLDRLIPRAIPNGSLATNFDAALARAIPALNLQFPLDSLRVTADLGQRWPLRRERSC